MLFCTAEKCCFRVPTQIARHRSGRSAGFAIVTFSRHEEALAAMQTIDNSLFLGRRLSVKWYQPERDNNQAGMDLHSAVAALPGLAMLQQQADMFQLAAARQDLSALTAAAAAAAADPALQAWMRQQTCAPEDVQTNRAPWSSLVNTWLNDYANQVSIHMHCQTTLSG